MDNLPKHHFPLSLPAIIIIFLVTFTTGIIIRLYLTNSIPMKLLTLKNPPLISQNNSDPNSKDNFKDVTLWLTYLNNESKFKLDYPNDFIVSYPDSTSPTQGNFLTAADAQTLVIFELPHKAYENSNLTQGLITVSQSSTSTEEDCYSEIQDNKAIFTEELSMNNALFKKVQISDDAAGTTYTNRILRNFQENTCTEITLTAALANTQNFDSSQLDSMTIVSGDEILDRLEDISRTFTYL